MTRTLIAVDKEKSSIIVEISASVKQKVEIDKTHISN